MDRFTLQSVGATGSGSLLSRRWLGLNRHRTGPVVTCKSMSLEPSIDTLGRCTAELCMASAPSDLRQTHVKLYTTAHHATTTTTPTTCNDDKNNMRRWICRSAARPKHKLDKSGRDNSRAHSRVVARREELDGTWSEHCRPRRRLGGVHQARACAAAHCSAATRKTPGKHSPTLRRARLLIGMHTQR